MSSQLNFDSATALSPRYSVVAQQKSSGSTYTPEDFAAFVADQIVQAADLPKRGKFRVLDPTCGDGALLNALLKRLPPSDRKRVEVVGYDTNSAVIRIASQRLRADFPELAISLEQKDFLDHVLNLREGGDLFSAGEVQEPFHLVIANQIKKMTADEVDEMAFPSDVALAIKSNLAVVTTLGEQIDLLEKRLQEALDERHEYGLLTSVPGIGRILAAIILLETGPIDRFASVGNFASYARCVDSQHMSNGKKKGEGNTKNGNTKNGNKYLSWAFVEAAYYAQRFCAEAKRFYERKKAKTNTAVATKALAHKLARACYHILKEQKPFDAARCFA